MRFDFVARRIQYLCTAARGRETKTAEINRANGAFVTSVRHTTSKRAVDFHFDNYIRRDDDFSICRPYAAAYDNFPTLTARDVKPLVLLYKYWRTGDGIRLRVLPHSNIT